MTKAEEVGGPTVGSASVEAATTSTGFAGSVAGQEAAIVKWLERTQKRDLASDEGHGYRSARMIAQAVGMETKTCRGFLRSMADRQLVKFCEFANGHFWSSTTPLPWQAGGSIAVAQEAEREAWKQPLTLVVQATWREREHTMSRDVKAYPEALRKRAESHVRSLTHSAEWQRRDDHAYGRQLQQGYSAPHSYRLVSL